MPRLAVHVLGEMDWSVLSAELELVLTPDVREVFFDLEPVGPVQALAVRAPVEARKIVDRREPLEPLGGELARLVPLRRSGRSSGMAKARRPLYAQVVQRSRA